MDSFHLGLGSKKTLRQILAEWFHRPTPGLLPGQYLLMIDIYEGQGFVDFEQLEEGGVLGAFIRLNNMAGGHHMDLMFDIYWASPTSLIKIPYFVYNPWVSGSSNFDWLMAHLPADAHAVMLDLEVVYPGYSKITYAAEVRKFRDLVKARLNHVIYTAEWFLPNLATWPADSGYVWAQYPSALYTYLTITWERLRELLLPFSQPANGARCPGPIRGWQCSGDRLTLPGSTKRMDVIVAYMALDELKAFAGVQAPPSGPTVKHVIDVYNNGDLVLDGNPYP